jgi:type 1 glutamine amidotransferase
MIRNLLLSGGVGHDFAATSAAIAATLRECGIETTIATEPAQALSELRRPEDAADRPRWHLLTVNALHGSRRNVPVWSLAPADAAVLEHFVTSGGGLLAIHTAVICFEGDPTWRRLCGAAWDWETSSHPPIDEVSVAVTEAGSDHPITTQLDDFSVVDEVYTDLDREPGIVPLLTSAWAGRAHPLLWAREVGRGRVVTDLLGHGLESIEHPTHRTLLCRAAAWAARSESASMIRPFREPAP